MNATLLFEVKSAAELKFNENEAYDITITEKQIKISSFTDFGAIPPMSFS